MMKRLSRGGIFSGVLGLAFLAMLVLVAVSGAFCAESKLDLEDLGRRAIEGDAQAQCDYAQACVTEGNTTEAFQWFLKSAEQGLPEAQYEVGYAYANGIGVEADPPRSIIWYRKAADQGFAEAMFELGLAYYKGNGVETDFGESVKWFAKAADNRHPAGMCGVGWMYLSGSGVVQDYENAYVFLNMAVADLADENRELCVGFRDEAASKLTPEQLARAQEESSRRFEGVHVTHGAPPLEDVSPLLDQEPTQDEIEFERKKELERLRFEHERKLQRQQMRDLKELERIRARRLRRR